MRAIHSKASLMRSGLAAAVFLVAASPSYAQVTTPRPTHAPQGPTWPASGGPDPSVTTCSAPADRIAAAAAGTNCPPPQPNRVQSFATEVVFGTPANLTWNNLKPGTYLIESGTHPSIQGAMGLYGVLVVTTAPTTVAPLGTAYWAAGVAGARALA